MQLTLDCVGIIGVYAPIVNCERKMTIFSPPIENCNCLALRQAARHVTQFYDQQLAPLGLRTTQFSILAKLSRLGGLTVQELAKELVMDRTTLGRNIQPLERDRLISVTPGKADRRRKEISITNLGIERLNAARSAWAHAQTRFQDTLGANDTEALRTLLRTVSVAQFGPSLLDETPQQSTP